METLPRAKKKRFLLHIKVSKHIYKVSRRQWSKNAMKAFVKRLLTEAARKLRMGICSLNARGLNEAGKRQKLIALCVKHKLSILAVQETKIPHCGTEDPRNLEDHALQATTKWKLYFSSGVRDSDREKLLQAKQARKPC